MKKLIFILLFMMAISSCQNKSPEEKMKIMVKLYLDSTLKDPKSYEPISFIIDTLTETEDPKTGKLYGYMVTHSFRAKNSFGALDINEMEFRIDSAIKKVMFAQKARYHNKHILGTSK